jgi:hypothetical protein
MTKTASDMVHPLLLGILLGSIRFQSRCHSSRPNRPHGCDNGQVKVLSVDVAPHRRPVCMTIR